MTRVEYRKRVPVSMELSYYRIFLTGGTYTGYPADMSLLMFDLLLLAADLLTLALLIWFRRERKLFGN